MAFSKSRTQGAVNRSRKAAKDARKAAGKSTGAKRSALLTDAATYEQEANRLVRLYAKEGVR